MAAWMPQERGQALLASYTSLARLRYLADELWPQQQAEQQQHALSLPRAGVEAAAAAAGLALPAVAAGASGARSQASGMPAEARTNTNSAVGSAAYSVSLQTSEDVQGRAVTLLPPQQQQQHQERQQQLQTRQSEHHSDVSRCEVGVPNLDPLAVLLCSDAHFALAYPGFPAWLRS